jgi:hypothetical protein
LRGTAPRPAPAAGFKRDAGLQPATLRFVFFNLLARLFKRVQVAEWICRSLLLLLGSILVAHTPV